VSRLLDFGFGTAVLTHLLILTQHLGEIDYGVDESEPLARVRRVGLFHIFGLKLAREAEGLLQNGFGNFCLLGPRCRGGAGSFGQAGFSLFPELIVEPILVLGVFPAREVVLVYMVTLGEKMLANLIVGEVIAEHEVDLKLDGLGKVSDFARSAAFESDKFQFHGCGDDAITLLSAKKSDLLGFGRLGGDWNIGIMERWNDGRAR
jgi:hypothetical protein